MIPTNDPRVLVCGGRTFSDVAKIQTALGDVLRTRGIATIIHGMSSGADELAGKWAGLHGIPVLPFPADWSTHGRKAGPIRNALMLAEGRPDLVVAFTGGRGTADMVSKARKAGIEVLEVR